MRKKSSGCILIAPLVLGCLVFYLAPFLLVLRFSFSAGSGKSIRLVGLENYQRILRNESFMLAFGNSLKFFAVGLPLIMVFAYLIALLMQKQADRHKLLKSVFLFPYIMPVAGTVLLVDLLFSEAGLLNSLLGALGLPAGDWLAGPSAFWVTIGLYLWKNAGYAVILLLAGLITIPTEQYESADLDGANTWQRFFYITTPQMWYSVFFALVFSVINGFKCFREIFLIGGQEPGDEIYMLQHFINNSFESMNYASLSVSSILLLAVILIVFGLFYGFAERKEAYRA